MHLTRSDPTLEPHEKDEQVFILSSSLLHIGPLHFLHRQPDSRERIGGHNGKYPRCFNGLFSVRLGGARTSHHRGNALDRENRP
jgi:hypothetical protein